MLAFLLQPQAAADGFGVTIKPGQGVRGVLNVKGVRDIAFGVHWATAAVGIASGVLLLVS